MPPRSASLWHTARVAGPWPRGGHHRTSLPLRSLSTASTPSKMPSPPSRRSKMTAQSDRSDLPPESPKYIFVPRAPQPDRFVVRRMKGILPRPRYPFQRHKTRDRPEELAAATPEPSRRITPPAKPVSAAERARLEAKASLAAERRALLRQGTTELRTRYEREMQSKRDVSAKHAQEAAVRLAKPEHESERLMAPSVTGQSRSARPIVDPAAGAKLALRRAKYEATMAGKRARRADALHTLYVKAADFVVDHAGLEKALDRAFEHPFYRANPDRSIWDQEGFPEGLDWLVAQQATSKAQYRAALGRSRDTRGIEPDDRLLRRGRERAERLADALMGGDLGLGASSAASSAASGDDTQAPPMQGENEGQPRTDGRTTSAPEEPRA